MSQEREGAEDYFAYLLRLWRETGGGTTRWRASLQDPHSGEKFGFAHLDELVAFLRERTGLAPLVESLRKAECSSKVGSKSEKV
jgi:hypothetical protein